MVNFPSNLALRIFAFVLLSDSIFASNENSTFECDAEVLIQTSRKQTIFVSRCRFELAAEEEWGAGPMFGICAKEEVGTSAPYYILDPNEDKLEGIPPVPWIHVYLEQASRPILSDTDIAEYGQPAWDVPGKKTILWRLVNFSVAGPTSVYAKLDGPKFKVLEGSWVYQGSEFVVSGSTATFRGKTYHIDYKYSEKDHMLPQFDIKGFGGGGGVFCQCTLTFENNVTFKRLKDIASGVYYSVDAGSRKATPYCIVNGSKLELDSGQVYAISKPNPDWSFQLSDRNGVKMKGKYSYEQITTGETREVLKFAGRKVELGPNLEGLWNADVGTLHIAFSTASMYTSARNVSANFWLTSLGGSTLEFSSSELGGRTANFRLKSDSPANFLAANALYFDGGHVYKQPDAALPQRAQIQDGMYYRGTSPYALKSGANFTTSSGVYSISLTVCLGTCENTFSLVDNVGVHHGGGSFNSSSITLTNGFHLTLGTNLNGVWQFKGAPLMEISFGTLIYRTTRRYDFTVPRPGVIDMKSNFGGGSATYDDKALHAEVIHFKNSVIITRTTTTHTTTTSQTLPPKELDILMVICRFKDYVPRINEETAMADLFDGQGSVRDLMYTSTYGRITVSREKSTVVTVQLDEDWASVTNCPYRDLGEKAMEKARGVLLKRQGSLKVDPDSFTFREIFFPEQPGTTSGCAWAGIANVGCGHPSVLPNPGGCKLYYRFGQPYVRAHEIGHTLGLRHAGGPLHGRYVEYGDQQSIMGNSYVFSSYSAASIYQIGGLVDGSKEVVEWRPESSNRLFNVQSLSAPARHIQGADAIAVKVHCPTCKPQVTRQAKHVGGYLWVSFRGNDGYSSFKLQPQWQNKVYIHLARPYTSLFYGRGTEIWASLGSNEAYSVHAPLSDESFSFFVCAISGNIAQVAIDVDEEAARKACK